MSKFRPWKTHFIEIKFVQVSGSVYFNSQLAFITIIKDVLFQEGIYTVGYMQIDRAL